MKKLIGAALIVAFVAGLMVSNYVWNEALSSSFRFVIAASTFG